MIEAVPYLLSGLGLGLGSGLTPGPLLTIIIGQTLRYGPGEGVKVSLAPLLTDAPIIAFVMLVLTGLEQHGMLFGLVSLAGAAYLAYLGWEGISFKGKEVDLEHSRPRSYKKGFIVNLLSPAPYMFWFTIGGPLLLETWGKSLLAAVAFMAMFYLLLVGSKVVLAVLVGKSRALLKSRQYVYTLKFLGLVLWVFAGFFIKNGLVYLGLI